MMNNQNKEDSLLSSNSNPGPVFYEIQIQGQLDPQRSKWFEGMTLTQIENGESGLACTLISGPVIDQPALHGLLTKIRDLNLILISVRRSIPRTNTAEEVSAIPEPFKDRDDFA
jgi:hypothetical protein